MRIGVIGTGAMGSNHLRVLSQQPLWQLTCAADVDGENLEKNCRGLEIIKLTDYRQALAHVDAVMVSTPTREHFSICRFFLENGKHVLVEKPISQTLEEADQMVALAEQKKLVLAVGHLERFNPAVEYRQPPGGKTPFHRDPAPGILFAALAGHRRDPGPDDP